MTDGFILVDKPTGMTSHDVVSTVRRVLGVSRVGHTGTLDPFATGLLVVLVGRATRLAQYVIGEPKSYEATIAFGCETTTDDSTGESRRDGPVPATLAELAEPIRLLTGDIDQVPPDYSAKHVQGRRAYAAARRGAPLELQPVRVRVDSWDVHEYTAPLLRATITCGGGTYIRALARDLGRLAGSAAHLARLRRIRSGPFHVTDAFSIEQIRAGEFQLRSPNGVVEGLTSVPLTAEDTAAVRHGRQVPAHSDDDRAALIDPDGHLLAIADRISGAWRPRVVLADA